MEKRETDDRKEILALEKENIELKHKFKMEEILAERENARLFHEKELERVRIKSAEIRKSQERKGWKDFGESYAK